MDRKESSTSTTDTYTEWADIWRRIAAETTCPAVRLHAEDVIATAMMRHDLRIIAGE